MTARGAGAEACDGLCGELVKQPDSAGSAKMSGTSEVNQVVGGVMVET
jgi:hypothetical protein